MFLYFSITYSHYDFSVPGVILVEVASPCLAAVVCLLLAGFGKWLGVAVLVVCATAGE